MTHRAAPARIRPWVVPALLIVGAVLVANATYLLGIADPNPMLHTSGLGHVTSPGLTAGVTPLDPSAGITSQALGHRAALDWLHGRVPWWNPYEGLGAPLAGEMQGAAFFPPTLLLALAGGQLPFYLLLEVVAGLSTYALLTRLGVARWIATVGGVAFALNGTAAWFTHAPANPVPFLPLALLGVERALAAAQDKRRGGYALLAVALALSLYAGFPETAYLDALAVAGWALARAVRLRRGPWRPFLLRCGAGATAGLALAAPVLVAFGTYLPHAYVGGHEGVFAEVSLPAAAAPGLLLPYVYGPAFAAVPADPRGHLLQYWGGVGGYLGAALIVPALVGVAGRRERVLRLTLAVGLAVTLARTYGVPASIPLVNLVPGLATTAFVRYGFPAASMCVVVLAALGLDDVRRRAAGHRGVAAGGVAGLLLVGAAGLRARAQLSRLVDAGPATPWSGLSVAAGGVAAAGLTVALLLLLAPGRARAPRVGAALAGSLVVLEAVGLFVVARLPAPRAGDVDLRPVAYLQQHLGTGRFLTLGPIAPNYGSYWGLRDLDVNDLPIPQGYVDLVAGRLRNPGVRLDPTSAAPLAGLTPQELLAHLPAFAELGVTHLVVPAGLPIPPAAAVSWPLVFSDPVADIYALPGAAPYAEVIDGPCRVGAVTGDAVAVTCTGPGRLLRREQYLPGWRAATAEGRRLAVTSYDGVFQAVDLPAGRTTVTFTYRPPSAGLAELAAFLACLALALPHSLVWLDARHRPS